MFGPLCVGLGLMLSPRSLVLVGNGMGRAGDAYLLILLSWLVLFLFTAASYGRAAALFPGSAGEFECLRQAFGPISAIVFPFSARALFAISVSTSLLAIAGYAFNEVFLPWFPNLAFSFCLLGLLVALNLTGPRTSEIAQKVFVGLASAGLLFLIGAGLLGPSGESPGSQPSGDFIIPIKTILSGFVLFVGFDLIGVLGESRSRNILNPSRMMVAGLLLAGALFILWGEIAARHVSADRLSETTVPHMVASRAILGQTGRVVMGMIVLAGVSGAVNGLFIAIPKMIRGMISLNLLPPFLGFGGKRFSIPLLLLAAGTAFMMGSGMAGEPILQVYIRASLCLWLLHYAFFHLSLLQARRISEGEGRSQRPFASLVIQGFSAALFSIVFFGQLWYDENSGPLMRVIAVVLAIAAAGACSWTFFGMKKK